MCFAMPAHAKLGESAAELIKRFGKPYAIENLKIGQTYKFRSENVSVDATFVDGVSVAETYFSDHPLNPLGEPPNDIVQAVLRTNAPQARWIEIEAGPFGADYALRSSDGKYIATLKYSGPQPESAIWTMTVAQASLLSPSTPATPGSSSSLSRRLTPAPAPGYLDRAIQEANRKEYEAAILELTKAVKKNPNDAELLAERGYKHSLIGAYDKAVSDYEAALKIRPNDHRTELRLQTAHAMLALEEGTLPSATPFEKRSASASHRIFSPGAETFLSNVIRSAGFGGAGVLYCFALARAFRQKTLKWIGAAVLAALFFGVTCLLFLQGLSEHAGGSRREIADDFSDGQSRFAAYAMKLRERAMANRRLASDSAQTDAQPSRFMPSPSPMPLPFVAEQVQRAVVQIAGLSPSGGSVASGTGFFISANGNLVTCWHVVSAANIDHIRVTRSDGSQCEIEGVLGFSAKDDLVLLKTAVTGADFLKLRASRADKPDVGTRILVFGNPGQLRGVWSEGAVSGFVFDVKFAKRDSLRFDAPVAPGSSGSPVVDTHKGDVLGIASATGWPLGNFGVPFYYITDLVDKLHGSTPVSLAQFKADLEKEKPTIKQHVDEKERAGDFMEAGQLCDDYSARYPGDIWGSWEHAQISFALDDYNAASFYTARLQPAKGPGDDLLCAIQFESGNALFWAPAQREWLKRVAELLHNDYGVEICTVQMRPDTGVNVRAKPDAKSDVLYEFDAGEHVFAKQDRLRNSAGKESVTWRKVLMLPSRDYIHGSEGWVNERYIAPLSMSLVTAEPYEKAAARGDVGAQVYLGNLYTEGKGVAQDYSKAAKFYEKAAAQGDALAEVNLGMLYYRGKGVAQDYSKAAELYRKSADQGNAAGQAYLGSLYAEGKGVQRDYQKAIELFHNAIGQESSVGSSNAFNDFAWFLATCPDNSQRNGNLAVTYATKACELTQWKDGSFIDTLAAACAEVGDFDTAIKYQKQAMDIHSDYPDRREMEKALELYQERKPYRADKKSLDVVDYFLLLPRDSFEIPPADLLRFLKQPKCGLIDLANGYISCTGDSAQAPFEVALFRFRDGSPLVAVCWGDHSEESREDARTGLVFLDFFRLGADKQMHKVSRSTFPVADAGDRKGNWRFELPRYGRTVLVRSQQSGAILHELKWNGAKFQDEK